MEITIFNTINTALGIGIFLLMFLIMVVKISPRKIIIEKKEKQNISIKNIAILGILFFATAVVSGATITGLLINQDSDEINTLSSKINKNNQIINSLENSIKLLKITESDEFLVKALNDLEEEIKKLREENEDLEEEIKDLEDDVYDIYAIFPISPY